MNRDEIIKMAREALEEESGRDYYDYTDSVHWWGDDHGIIRFAALIAAAEREACANVAKAISDKYAFGYYGQEVDTADEIEAAIRAMGTP